MKRSNGNTSTSSPKKCKIVCDIEKQFEDLDSVFQNVDFTNLIMDLSNESACDKICLQSTDKRICLKELGNSVYLTCELFRSSILVHIRKFVRSSEIQPLAPTKIGVCMDLKSWYHFFQKIHGFNLVYTASSFIANNGILVLSKDGLAEISNIQKGSHIVLCEEQLDNLISHIESFNETVLTFLYENHLSDIIANKVLPTKACDDFSECELSLISVMEKNLQTVFKSEFQCQGCIQNCSGQMRHTCMIATDLEKFVNLGEYCLLMLDFGNVAEMFVNQTQTISTNFLTNLNFNVLKGVLFKTSNDL